jgi:hypothetical protein
MAHARRLFVAAAVTVLVAACDITGLTSPTEVRAEGQYVLESWHDSVLPHAFPWPVSTPVSMAGTGFKMDTLFSGELVLESNRRYEIRWSAYGRPTPMFDTTLRAPIYQEILAETGEWRVRNEVMQFAPDPGGFFAHAEWASIAISDTTYAPGTTVTYSRNTPPLVYRRR